MISIYSVVIPNITLTPWGWTIPKKKSFFLVINNNIQFFLIINNNCNEHLIFGRFLYHKAFSSAQPGLSKAVRWEAACEPHFFFPFFSKSSKSSYCVLGWNQELPKQENRIKMSCRLALSSMSWYVLFSKLYLPVLAVLLQIATNKCDEVMRCIASHLLSRHPDARLSN